MAPTSVSLDDFLNELQRARSKIDAGEVQQRQKRTVGNQQAEERKGNVQPNVEGQLESYLLLKNTSKDKSYGDQSESISNCKVKIVEHVVKNSDTVQGILLKYDCSLRDLKCCNHMTSDRLTSYTVLKVPVVEGMSNSTSPTKDEKLASAAVKKIRRDRLLNALQTALPGLEKKEARFYLSDADWCISKAVQRYQEDIHWESNNPFVPSDVNKSKVASQMEAKRCFSLLRAFRRWRRSSKAVRIQHKRSMEMPLLRKDGMQADVSPPQME